MFKTILKKRMLLLAILSTFSVGSFAQLSTLNGTVTNSGNNNVGVGTNNPSSKLEVKSVGSTGVLQLNFSGSPGLAGPFGESGPLVFPSHVFRITDLTYSPNSTKFLIDIDGKTQVGNFSGITTNSFLSTRNSFSVFNNNSNSTSISYISDAPFLKWNTSNNSNFTFSNNAMDVMTLTSTGNVGIGVSNPTAKLDVKGGDIKVDNGDLNINNGDLKIDGGNLVLASGSLQSLNNDLTFNETLNINHNVSSDWHSALKIKVNRDNSRALDIVDSNNNNRIFSVWGSGIVNTKKIYAEEVEVRADAIGIHWPDYVFEKNYDLMPLKEVNKYINKNGHLPNVPSEKEVMENGINLGKMDAILLRKVEELTLYVIQLKKENESLKVEVEKLKKQK